MARLPYSRVVDVTLTRRDRFATAQGFSVPIVVASEAVSGEVDASHRTKVYGSLLEVSADFPSGSEAYKAAAAEFGQPVRPRQIKIAYRNPANNIIDELNTIYDADPDWYWLGFTHDVRDNAEARGAADWAETKSVLAGFDSNDTDTETPSAIADPSSTATITIASPGVVSWAAHGLVANEPVRFSTSGALPTGLTAGTVYYVKSPNAGDFQVSATPGGAAINTSGTQSGTHTVTALKYGGSFAEYAEAKGYDRTFTFYHTDGALYPAPALMAYCATRDLDRGNLRAAQRGDINSGNAYTAKFKRLAGITPINKASAAVQGITGFVPALGIDAAQGHRANTYVDIGGLPMVVEGVCASGAFIDEIHASDWLVARGREALLSTLANNDRVPYTNVGAAVLCNALDGVMRRAVAAGIIAGDFGATGNEFIPAYTITHDRVEDIPESQRRNRIAPDIKVTFRYAGAFHYATASITFTF